MSGSAVALRRRRPECGQPSDGRTAFSPALVSTATFATATALSALVAAVLARHGTPFPVDSAVHQWALGHRLDVLADAAIVVTTTGSGPIAYLVAMAAGAAAVGPSTVGGSPEDDPSRGGIASRASSAAARRPSATAGAGVLEHRARAAPRTPAHYRRRWLGALAAAAALAVGQLIRFALATSVGRPRPSASDWVAHAGGAALPSGHTTTSALAAALVCAAVVRRCRGAVRTAGVVAALSWAGTVGLTRVYLGVHWPTDVLAGWLLATTLSLTAILAVRAVRRRRGSASRTTRRGRR